MKRKHIYIIIACLILIAITRIFFFGGEKQKSGVSVTVSPVAQKDVTISMQTVGTVQAYSTVDIKSMVTGSLLATGFKEGDVVEQNQLLFTIDPRSFAANVNLAKANLARDQATLANADSQIARNAPLVKKGVIAKQDFDTLTANEKSSAATVAADQAAVENAELQLSYTSIRAPIPGKTGNISLKQGSIIKANDTVALVTINQINPIYVTFSVPQNKLPLIQESMARGPLVIKASVGSEVIEKGVISFVNNAIDTTTGTIELKATFPNRERRLWPGQYVTVDVPVEAVQKASVIPSLALMSGQKGFYVYVVGDDAVVHLRMVTPGPIIGDKTVIEAGLQPGENVVVAGQLRLKDGVSVVVHTKP